MTPEDAALLELLRRLAAQGYAFVTPTPATHARVLKRPGMRRAWDLRGVFGWSLPFDEGALSPGLLALMRRAGALEETVGGLRSRYRVASLGDRLFLHSAYPTTAGDAVFFGPDSYRFAALIDRELTAAPPGAVIDIGAGAGVGGLTAASALPGRRLVMTDINPQALRLARINAAFAGVEAETVETDGLEGVEGEVAVALANPPYIADDAGRDYRDGGGMHGGQLSVDLAKAAATRLAPGGRLILYTGAAIVAGRDPLKHALQSALGEAGCRLDYREIDPDVFGEELEKPAYRDVERIAVVAAVAVKED